MGKGFLATRAFTLSEVLIASAILLLAVLGLLTLFINCIFLNESNANLVTAIGDAQYVLEQIKGLAYSDIQSFCSSYPADSFQNLNEEAITITQNIGISIAEVTINVNWNERGRTKTISLPTKIAR